MVIFIQEYYNTVVEKINIINKKQENNIKKAGALIANTIRKDGLVHVFGCGHSHMVSEELFYRAGGLVQVNPMFESSVMLHEGAIKSSQIERMKGYARNVIERYPLCETDTFIISSTSGINSFPIEMAEEARKKGTKVIGISSENYFNEPSRYADNVYLADMCDININNYVEVGDASIQVSDNGTKAGPISSILSFFIANCLMLQAEEELKISGVAAKVLISGNVPNGYKKNMEYLKEYIPRVKHL